MATARNVTVIPARINPTTGRVENKIKKRKVAGYARVSTDKDEQFTSFEAQTDYYTKFIQSNSAWEFVKVYTDEGITGTSTRHREGFNQMVEDALAGKIDLIITKSVSRFARNTVDSLTTVRKLKEHGVEVYFEKENIYTFDGKGELLITIMSSLAQEESRSISENVTWGQRKRMADGKVNIPYKHFLGYEHGEGKDAPPVVNPEQAEIVKRIYREFKSGKTAWTIAKELTADGIPTPAGRTKWPQSTIESILTNEKYKGAALLQKRVTLDFLSSRQKNGRLCNWKWRGGKPSDGNIVGTVSFPPDSFVPIAANSSAQKYGTQRTNIAEPSGSVMANTRGNIAVAHPIWTKNISKAPLSWHSIQ